MRESQDPVWITRSKVKGQRARVRPARCPGTKSLAVPACEDIASPGGRGALISQGNPVGLEWQRCCWQVVICVHIFSPPQCFSSRLRPRIHRVGPGNEVRPCNGGPPKGISRPDPHHRRKGDLALPHLARRFLASATSRVWTLEGNDPESMRSGLWFSRKTHGQGQTRFVGLFLEMKASDETCH